MHISISAQERRDRHGGSYPIEVELLLPRSVPPGTVENMSGQGGNRAQRSKRPPFSLIWRSQLHFLATIVMAAISVPVVVLGLLLLPFIARPFATVERYRYLFVSGHKLRAAPPTSGGGWRGRVKDPTTWRESSHFIVTLALGVGFAILLPIEIGFGISLFRMPFIDSDQPVSWSAWFLFALGVIAVAVSVLLNTALVSVQLRMSRILLDTRQEELEKSVESLSESRTVLIDSFDNERQRIERDLHDGVQQKLIDLTLTLGLLRLRLDKGDTDAKELAVKAQAQTRDTIATLRNTIQGILPPVLQDYGLHAAVRDLTDASSLDIALDLAIPSSKRWPERVERAAYYIVSEALANVAKHSGTTAAEISIRLDSDALHVAVADIGQGGANSAKGSGLSGMHERATSIGGTFAVRSNEDGTVIAATLPTSLPDRARSSGAPTTSIVISTDPR